MTTVSASDPHSWPVEADQALPVSIRVGVRVSHLSRQSRRQGHLSLPAPARAPYLITITQHYGGEGRENKRHQSQFLNPDRDCD